MMEFEDEHEEEEEEQDEEDEEMAITPTTTTTPTTTAYKPMSEKKPLTAVRYRECLKNHAVGIGGHAVDGCGEFMPAGSEGSLDALKCAACNCHRNFHRKEILPFDASPQNQLTLYSPRPHQQVHPPYHHPPHQHPPQVYNIYRGGPTTVGPPGYLHSGAQQGVRPLGLPLPLPSPSPTSGGEGEDVMMMNTTSSSGGKKRFRTKFSQDQKEKMLELADKLGWRIQKQDETVVQQFCNETGVKRHVLKVWMHNNKHTLGKKP